MNRQAVQIIVGAMMLLAWGLWGAQSLPTTRLEAIANFPNPFDSRLTVTTISYSLKNDASVSVHLFDYFGGTIRRWEIPAGLPGAQTGTNRLVWDGTNESGEKVTAGGYVCQILVSEESGVVQGIRKIGVIH